MTAPTTTLTDHDRQFIDAIRAVVAETGPDYTYPAEWMVDGGCNYVVDDQAACLIGRALHRMGITIAELRDHEGESAVGIMEAVGTFTHRVIEAAQRAQDIQDAQRTWGDALAAFERHLGTGQ